MSRYFARDVLAAVADQFHITVDDLTGARRDGHAAAARNLACLLVRRFCPHLSHRQIGEMLGGRDHSTSVKAVARAERKLARHPRYARDHLTLVARITRDDAEQLDRAIAEANQTLDGLWRRRLAAPASIASTGHPERRI